MLITSRSLVGEKKARYKTELAASTYYSHLCARLARFRSDTIAAPPKPHTNLCGLMWVPQLVLATPPCMWWYKSSCTLRPCLQDMSKRFVLMNVAFPPLKALRLNGWTFVEVVAM